MESKFFRSKDYDQLLTEIEKDIENPFGLFKDVYMQNKERNPDFLKLTLKGIKRKQDEVWRKWLMIDFTDSQMTLEGQVYQDHEFCFYEDLKNFIFELHPSQEKQITEIRMESIEKLLVLHYLETNISKQNWNSKPMIYFLSNLLSINPNSVKKRPGKIEDYTINNLTAGQIPQILPTLEKVHKFFIDSDLQFIAQKVEIRIKNLKQIAGKD